MSYIAQQGGCSAPETRAAWAPARAPRQRVGREDCSGTALAQQEHELLLHGGFTIWRAGSWAQQRPTAAAARHDVSIENALPLAAAALHSPRCAVEYTLLIECPGIDEPLIFLE